VHASAVESTKLWVDPESSKAERWAPLTITRTCIVRPDRGWILVMACKDIVGDSSISSSSRSSMRNNLLHTSRWPGTKCSSHLKHMPFVRRSEILAGENFLLVDARP
jgi:hypothetical protein